MKKIYLLVAMAILSLGVYSQDISAKKSQTSKVAGKTVIQDTKASTNRTIRGRKTNYIYKDAKGNTFQVYQRSNGTYFILVQGRNGKWGEKTVKLKK